VHPEAVPVKHTTVAGNDQRSGRMSQPGPLRLRVFAVAVAVGSGAARWQLQLVLALRGGSCSCCRTFSAWLESAGNRADISSGYDMP
jgi:hypothetical protein